MNAPTCLCHFINSTKTPILMWKHNEKQWVLKIADQKFLSGTRVDKHGTVYWKFKNWAEQPVSSALSETSSNNSSQPVATASIEKGEVRVELPSTCADSTCPLNPCPLKENVNPESTATNSNCPESPK